jgi:hypothetical protein
MLTCITGLCGYPDLGDSGSRILNPKGRCDISFSLPGRRDVAASGRGPFSGTEEGEKKKYMEANGFRSDGGQHECGTDSAAV